MLSRAAKVFTSQWQHGGSPLIFSTFFVCVKEFRGLFFLMPKVDIGLDLVNLNPIIKLCVHAQFSGGNKPGAAGFSYFKSL